MPAAIPKNLRAHDQSIFLKKRKDFFIRKHGFSSLSLYEVCLANLMLLAGVGILVYNHALLGSVLCAIVGIVLYAFAWQIDKYKKLLITTEFLNALFASVLGTGHRFCMVATQDDAQIVYLDRAFQQMFPEMVVQPKRMLEHF